MVLAAEEYDFLRDLASKLPDAPPQPEASSSPAKRTRPHRDKASGASLTSNKAGNPNTDSEDVDSKMESDEDYVPEKRSKLKISSLISKDD